MMEGSDSWTGHLALNFAFRQKGIPEYLGNGVIPLYKGCKTAVSVDGKLTS